MRQGISNIDICVGNIYIQVVLTDGQAEIFPIGWLWLTIGLAIGWLVFSEVQPRGLLGLLVGGAAGEVLIMLWPDSPVPQNLGILGVPPLISAVVTIQLCLSSLRGVVSIVTGLAGFSRMI